MGRRRLERLMRVEPPALCWGNRGVGSADCLSESQIRREGPKVLLVTPQPHLRHLPTTVPSI